MKPRSHAPIHGMVTPLVTPFCDGELDVGALQRLTLRVLDQGRSHGLMLLGTTGEGPLLSPTLARRVVATVAPLARERSRLIVNVSQADLETVLERAAMAADHGAHAVALNPPWYFRVGDEELIRWCQATARASPLPVVLYNMPSHVPGAFNQAVYRRLAEEPTIIGVKDSGGDWAAFESLIDLAAQCRPDWSVVAGPEAWLLPALQRGAAGATVASLQIAPEAWARLYRLAGEPHPGGDALAERLIGCFSTLMALFEGDAQPTRALKAALAWQGICRDELAWPLKPCPPKQPDAFQNALALLFDEPATAAPGP